MENRPLEDQSAVRVLIVDDHLEQTNLMRHGIQFHAFPLIVEFVATIAAAQNYLAKEVPDIVVTELVLPDGVAVDLLAEDPESADYPVVILTDRGSEKEAVDALKSGFLDYVVKTRRKCQEIGNLLGESLKTWSKIRSVHKAEVNLQQTLRLAHSIMDSLPDPIGVLDDEGMLILTNHAWNQDLSENQLFGNDCQIKSNYLDFCRNSLNPMGRRLAELIESVVENQEATDPIAYRLNETSKAWYSFAVHPCQGSGRARAIVVHQDISDRKRLEGHQLGKENAIEMIRSLTRREKQVMDLVVDGKPNKMIARLLEISVKTVEMHRANLMKKLKIRSVADLVRLAVKAGTLIRPVLVEN